MTLLVLIFCVLAALGVSVWLAYHLRDREQSQRWLCAAMPILWCLFAIKVLGGTLHAPFFIWNEIRLSRSLALLRGFHLYPGEHDLGPIVGTLHEPLGHYLFLPAAAIQDPTMSILAGSLLACVIVFFALGFALLRSAPAVGGRGVIAAVIFLFCAFLIVGTEGGAYSLFGIHVDAAALAFATIACAFVSGGKRMTDFCVWMSAAACVLAIASKQTIAPVALAIAFYIAIAEGARRFVLFLVAGAISGGAVLGFLIAIIPARALFFNTIVLASHRPLKPEYMQILGDAFRMAQLEAMPALFPVLFLAICSWMAAPQPGIRQFFATNRWIVFLMAAAALLPVSTKAVITLGADVNHLGFVLYFLFVAAGLAIQQYFSDPHPVLRVSARLFLGIGILVSLPPFMANRVQAGLRYLRTNPSQTAYTYNLRHPGMAYFAWNPMACLLKDGKLYHFDYALYDREVAGYPVTPRQLQSGLPSSFTLVAVPPGESLQSQALRALVANFVRIDDPELPGWTVYRRAP